MHNELRDQIHAANVEAGWWTDLSTGESTKATRNRPEMLCLIGSEIIEAHTDGQQPDGHLPEYPAFQVEVADAAIRILDLAGADEIDLEAGAATSIVGQPINDLMSIMTLVVGYALEGYRKSNAEVYHKSIADAYASLFQISRVYDFNLMEVIEAKAAYNKQRQDHKIENRIKDGGKKL